MRWIADLLASWGTFYVLIGTAAAGLTGLMFVVITLARGTGRSASADGVSVFSTPTVVHFSCVLLTAAVMTAPFHFLVPIEIVLGLAGAAGLVYVAILARRTSRMQGYKADTEDWTWHLALPIFAYAMLFGGAIAMHRHPVRGLYAPAAAVTLLIFIGIHNAWDVVTFLATGKADELPDPPSGDDVTPRS